MATFSFTCPYCEFSIELPDDVWAYSCPDCRRHLDLKSQFAYLRGLEAFTEGQTIIDGLSPRKRRLADPHIKEAMSLFMEAYSSLQVAFLAELEQAQKSLGVEMMASMSDEFSKWNMVSEFEMSYWKAVMVELTAQNEYDQIQEKLAQRGSWTGVLRRAHWRMRRRQLVKALADLDSKLRALERQINFIEKPRARNLTWKP